MVLYSWSGLSGSGLIAWQKAPASRAICCCAAICARSSGDEFSHIFCMSFCCFSIILRSCGVALAIAFSSSAFRCSGVIISAAVWASFIVAASMRTISGLTVLLGADGDAQVSDEPK